MKNSVTIAGVTAESGQKAYGAVSVPDLFPDGQPLEIPFIIINGSEDGPRLYIQVAQHAGEIHALEGIRRVFADMDPRTLSGAVTFSLPNPMCFRFSTYYTLITHDINRVGYGDPNGSLMERMVNTWWTNFVEDKADYVIDFHTASPGFLLGKGSPVFVYYEGYGVSPGVSKEVAEKSERMAKLLSAEVLNKETEPYGGGLSFRGACVKHGIPAIVPELDGPFTFIEPVVELTVRGLKNIMVDIGMIEGKIELPDKQYILKWVANPRVAAVRTNKGGVFIPSVKVGDIVKKGDKVGMVYSPRTLQEIETLTAHQDGYIFGIPENPVKTAGELAVVIEEILEVIENR